MSRSIRIWIRAGQEEKEAWEAAAKRLGYRSLSALIRDAVEKLIAKRN